MGSIGRVEKGVDPDFKGEGANDGAIQATTECGYHNMQQQKLDYELVTKCNT